MRPVLRSEGGHAVKRYPPFGRFDVTAIARQSDVLRACGVSVPKADLDLKKSEIRLSWIDGRTLRQLIAETGPVETQRGFAELTGWLRPILSMLGRLHRVPAGSAGFRRYEPFAHIDRRLESGSPVMRQLPRRLARRARQQREAIGTAITSLAPACVVHGDFHAGQMILENGTAKWWMLDLDDVAMACPEADLGNFAAHFLTSPDLYAGTLDDGFRRLSALLGRLHGEVSAIPLDAGQLRLFGAVAFLRRALKAAEAGQPPLRVSRILAACEALAR